MRHLFASYLALLVLLAAPPRGWADTKAKPGASSLDDNLEQEILHSCAKSRGKVQVSFRPGAALSDLVSWAMSFSCKNFVYRSDLATRSSKVDIVAPAQLSPKQSWHLFQVALQSLGLTIVRKGVLLHIVESAQAATFALPIRDQASGGQNLERLIVQPMHIGIEDAQSALSALKSPQGSIVSLPTAGALLVTDYGAHTSRMAQLLRQVDRAGSNERLFAIHLQYADVEVISKQLSNLLAVEGGAQAQPPRVRGKSKSTAPSTASTATPSLIVADARTGTLLLRANQATYLRALRLVQELDRKLESDDTSRIHIYPLQHADANKLALTLNALLSKGVAPDKSTRDKTTSAPPSSGAAITGTVHISADAETNSLLVLASRRDYQATVELIADLDHQRPQVFLEVTILEVDLDDDLDYGGSFHLGSQQGEKLLLGGSQHQGSRTTPSKDLGRSLQQDGLVAGALGSLLPTEKFLGVSIPSFAVLFQAVAEDKRIDILSAPQLMTTNNTPAKLSVGQNVPYKAGSSTAGGGVSDTIKREDVEMTLDVTPHVNLGGMVRLEFELNIKELLPNQEGLEPTWTTRKIVNTVVVADQESIAIGGLASTKESVTKSKVPLLGDIPFVGALFRGTRKRKSKRNLMVLLTPYVISSSDEARRLTQRKLHERDTFLRSFKALRKRKFEHKVDYRKKRGLLEDINVAVQAQERKAATVRELQRPPAPVDGPLELPETSADGGRE